MLLAPCKMLDYRSDSKNTAKTKEHFKFIIDQVFLVAIFCLAKVEGNKNCLSVLLDFIIARQ